MIKKLVSLIFFILGCYFLYDHDYFNVKEIVKDWRHQVVVPKDNQYKKETVVSYVKDTDDFVPNNKQELLNIYYTTLNSGWTEFTFYCPDEYNDCINDVKTISEDTNKRLSHLNSFVEPFNSYNNIYTTYYESGKVTLRIKHLYDQYTINKINKKIDELYPTIVNQNKSIRDNILAIHDYIINNTKYDTRKIDNINDETYESNTAYGILFEGYGVCSGYADIMAIFLDRMKVPNIKVATEDHVWNLVYLDGKWLHLDLTWDDPVTDTGKQVLSHSFFLITSGDINKYNTGQHSFNLDIYREAL